MLGKHCVSTALFISLAMQGSPATADDTATDLAGATGCGILATLVANPQLQVAAGGACIYGTQVAKDKVAELIDDHFDSEDQKFADTFCLTIIKADGSKIEPQSRQNCSEEQ